VEVIHCNVADDASVRAMVEAAQTAFGRIDILINNAGTTHLPAPMEDVSRGRLRQSLCREL
jgi:3-oxoacyl-[acyl-carrier protein] reductase